MDSDNLPLPSGFLCSAVLYLVTFPMSRRLSLCDSRTVLFPVQTLFAGGVKVNCRRTSDGATPLYAAAENGHSQCVKVGVCDGLDYKIKL